jgi:ribosome-associated translation inhibitor RaiA
LRFSEDVPAAPARADRPKKEDMHATTDAPEIEVDVRTRGPVSAARRDAAVEKLRAAWSAAPRPVIHASLELTIEANPALERPAMAKASVDVSGRVIRAHVANADLETAIGLMCDRVRRNIRRMAERREAAAKRSGVATEGEWRHGDLPPERPEFFPRPVEERELVRHKSYSILHMTPEEAAFEMDMLGYDFHLFTDAGTHSDCVIARRDDGELELVSGSLEVGKGPAGEPAEFPVRHAPTMSQEEALKTLDASTVSFVSYVDEQDNRMRLVYRRYDGHYGLVAPADV